MTQKLVIKINKVTMIDIIPYLSDGPKSDENLSFPNPPLMTQKELIGVFKWEAVSQGTSMRLLPTLLPNCRHEQEEGQV